MLTSDTDPDPHTQRDSPLPVTLPTTYRRRADQVPQHQQEGEEGDGTGADADGGVDQRM
jgi:hypothetical protein